MNHAVSRYDDISEPLEPKLRCHQDRNFVFNPIQNSSEFARNDVISISKGKLIGAEAWEARSVKSTL
jgi:hypothetical protein